MTSVFLSYDREDVGNARRLAAALERCGHDVWWDRHIRGGAEFSDEIDRALAAADAVVVIWSQRSIASAWVRDEATAGRDRGRLLPVKIDDCSPPLGFRQYQTIDLPGGRVTNSAALAELDDALAKIGTGSGNASLPRRALCAPARWPISWAMTPCSSFGFFDSRIRPV